MKNNNMKLQPILLIIAAALFMILAGYVHAATQSGQTDQPSANAGCGVTVQIEGEGSVRITRLDGSEVLLDAPGNQLRAECGETLRLLAGPNSAWRFQEWRGVEGVDGDTSAQLELSGPALITAVFVPLEVRYLPLDKPVYDRNGELVYALPYYASSWQSLAGTNSTTATTSAPQIAVWYGARQPFGTPGVPQEWMDVLGTASDLDNDLSTLEYKLNNGAFQPLNFGGNGTVAATRRLSAGKGDFVIDLPVSALKVGDNVVAVRATDSLGAMTQAQVVVEYTAGQIWPIPANVDWNRTGNLLNEAAVVDGQWALEGDGTVRTAVIGYDRLLNVGDIGWTSYEAVVPVRINSFSADGFTGVNAAPALGIVMGWQGHTDDPIACGQPKCGWLPVGMATWYEYDKPGSGQPPTGDGGFSMWVRHTKRTDDPSGMMLTQGITYLWKVQANRTEGANGTYRLKVWPAGGVEPAAWLLEVPGTADSQAAGSLLLLAHYVDVTLGDVEIRPLNGDFTAPVISNLQAVPEQNQAVLSWTTNEPTTAEIEYFSNPGDVKTAVSNALSTTHQVTLTNLQPGTDYVARVTASDSSLNRSLPAERTFKTTEEVGQTYTLKVTTKGYGTVQVTPDKAEYDSGEQVSLFAKPLGPLWTFKGWGGDAAGTANPLVVTITKDTVIEAEFQKTANYLPYISGSN